MIKVHDFDNVAALAEIAQSKRQRRNVPTYSQVEIDARKAAFQNHWEQSCANEVASLPENVRSRVYDIAKSMFNGGANYMRIAMQA